MKVRICIETSAGLHESYLELEWVNEEDIPRIIADKTGIVAQEGNWEICDEIS